VSNHRSALSNNTSLTLYQRALWQRIVLVDSPFTPDERRCQITTLQEFGRGNPRATVDVRVIVLDRNLLACGDPPSKTEVCDSRKNDGRSVSGFFEAPVAVEGFSQLQSTFERPE
jgi:hypothetical protein